MKLQLKIEKLVYNGYALGRSDGLVVFVPFAVPGDILLVEIVERKKDYAFAVIREILEPSPYRVEPICENFTRCGGCQWLNVDYGKQLEEKEAILEREFTRESIPIPQIEIIKGKPFQWRRRAKLFVEKRVIGFKSFRGSEVVPIGRCPQLTETLNKALLNLYTYPSLLKQAEEIWMGEDKDQKQLLVYIKSTKKMKEIHHIFHSLKENTGKKIGLRIAYKHKLSTLGVDVIEESILGKKLFYTFRGFFQANRFLVEKLVETVVKESEKMGKINILELYSGVGTFTVPLSNTAEKLTAVEANILSIQMMKKAIEANNIENIEIMEMSVEKALEKLDISDFHLLVVDPPRIGMKKEAIDKLKEAHFKKIIYISCNPVTMARDIKRFNAKVEKLYLIDQFPNTFHIEAVAVLAL